MRTCTLTNASSAAVHVGAVKPAARALHMTCTRSTLSGNRIPLRQLSRHARPASAQRRPTTMGLPIPIIGPLFNPFFAFVGYALGAARFWSNYSRTTFENTEGTKRKLTALWPFLFVSSQSFREGFKKTLSD